MKRTILVVALAVALTFAFTASAYAMDASAFETDYYTWAQVSGLGANPANPGVHANYLATTAKCGICHSVHRARGDGFKLLNATVATCAGCHAAGTGTVTTKLVSWQGGGPHSSGNPALCAQRACHATTPHGVGASTYPLFAAKLINVGVDVVVGPIATAGTNGFDVQDLNAVPAPTNLTPLTEAERQAVVAGYTCAQAGCHQDTMLTVLVKNHAEARLDPAVNKTGHLSVAAFNAAAASYKAVAGCTSCHDQTDGGTTSGYTFPHSQTAQGATNLADRAYLWMGRSGYLNDMLVPVGQLEKAYDGTCLKCHRGTDGLTGIGKDH